MDEQMIRKNNMKIYPIYKMFSWDLLFYYAIIFLFLTQVKGFTASQILIADAFYAVFRIFTQISSVKIIDFIGKKKSLLLGNIFVTISMVGVTIGNSLVLLIFLYLIQAAGYSLKVACEPTLLSDSIPKSSSFTKIYSKIDSKGNSKYYIFDAISSFSTGFLYVINPYIPLIMCCICCLIATLISLSLDEPVSTSKSEINFGFISYYKDLNMHFKQILKSKRLKSLFIFAIFFNGLLSVFGTLRSSILVDINLPNQYFGIIVSFMQIIAAFSSKRQDWFNRKFKNRTLSWFSLSIVSALIITGLIVISNINYFVSLCFVLLAIILVGIVKGPYYTLFQRYLNSFTNPDVNTKIFAIESIVGNVGRVSISLVTSFLLSITTTSYVFVIIGCIFFIIFVFLLDYMRNKVGLAPEQYTKEDLAFTNEIELK